MRWQMVDPAWVSSHPFSFAASGRPPVRTSLPSTEMPGVDMMLSIAMDFASVTFSTST
tara:strand:- start:51340 stop:51513 length:174 start_codon:yes stop_codon:yes gene_type:complete